MNTQTTGQTCPKTNNQDDAVASFLDRIAAQDTERQAATDAGLPALYRLVEIADRDTGQAGTVRLFLLGLYNGYRFPFNLITLRGLDKSLFDDCMAVLTMDARATLKEIHHYIKLPHASYGAELFERWARMAGGDQ